MRHPFHSRTVFVLQFCVSATGACFIDTQYFNVLKVSSQSYQIWCGASVTAGAWTWLWCFDLCGMSSDIRAMADEYIARDGWFRFEEKNSKICLVGCWCQWQLIFYRVSDHKTIYSKFGTENMCVYGGTKAHMLCYIETELWNLTGNDLLAEAKI